MIPRSGGGGQEVNSRKADEVFAEHGGKESRETLRIKIEMSGLVETEMPFLRFPSREHLSTRSFRRVRRNGGFPRRAPVGVRPDFGMSNYEQ